MQHKILEELREKTRSNHKAIEQNRLLASLLDPTLTEAGYVRVLRKFYGFFMPLEKRLSEACERTGLADVLKSRLKTPLLRKDLEFLTKDLNDDFYCRKLPPLDSEAFCLGTLYVTEGSTLGGQIIVKAVESSVGVGPETGAAYFNGYGASTMILWAETCKVLEDFAQRHSSEQPHIVSAAIDTFNAMQKWFDE